MNAAPEPPGDHLIGGHEYRAIEVIDYDPDWPRRFILERDKLRGALGEAALTVQHVGSTAVPALAAKPIIDVLVTVTDVEDESRYLPALLAAGYQLRVREPQHRMVRTPGRDVHVHVWPQGHPAAQAHLTFRDRLRTSPADRKLYAETKRRLAMQDWPTMNHYADAKSEVIRAILSRSPT